ncbi:MAG: di-trans,poly-cis-decaprenylcistransferase [Patescibacteria group bacterium]|nr:di-trans,poly-cis-decaprenylcistransferase [Patescibacteria group bacterium]
MATVFDKFPTLTDIPVEKFPKHIFIIPDGNGRWAHDRGLPASMGHKKGYEAAEKILKLLSEIPSIHVVTMWGFSADNWKRSSQEVGFLMKLFEQVVKKAKKEFLKNNRRFVHLGRKDRIPGSLRTMIEETETLTQENLGQIFCLAVDFGGEDQIIRMLEKVQQTPTMVIDTEVLWKLRDGHGVVPPADLLIRTSGEQRTSDVGWLNGAPTELFFIKKPFPDLTIVDVIDAILSFSKRERRMGARK